MRQTPSQLPVCGVSRRDGYPSRDDRVYACEALNHLEERFGLGNVVLLVVGLSGRRVEQRHVVDEMHVQPRSNRRARGEAGPHPTRERVERPADEIPADVSEDRE